ncbi:MAG: 30S ribosomal protein S5 [Candidatus Brocadiae bacterium]|nr:30S ribosomal protein S5 [Candidatus Brocadiia bacterium]
MRYSEQEAGVLEEVIAIRFHTKVTKGGRKLTCAALVTVGDGRGKVGLGYGKARSVPMAIEKGTKEARAQMKDINLVGDTVAHEVTGRHGSARVFLKPATQGTGVKAGKTTRAILQVAGVHNVLSKLYGNSNPMNVAKATMNALEQMNSVEEVEKLRGVRVRLFHPQAREPVPAAVEADEPPEESG